MGYINKIQIDSNSAHLIEPTLFAITSGTASAYIAEISNFELTSGVNIYLQVHNNNEQNATLNINSLGEKDIFYKNKKIVANQLKKDYLYSLVYDGVKWQLVGDTSGIWEGNAETSTKWAAAQTVYVALDVVSKTTSIQGGGSAVALGIDGILGPAHGGTGKASLKDAGNAIINALDTSSSVLTGEDYMITQYVGGGTTTTTYYRRKAKDVRVGGLITARKLWGNDFDGTVDISGGLTVFGGIGLNHNTIDLKVSNNGVSSNTNRVFAWYDKSSLYYARIYGRADTDGKTHLFLHAGNYDTAQHFGGIDITSAKDGTITYSISAPANFRSAIGTWALISDSYNTIMPADGTTNGWYKFGTSNTSYGILPSASGTAGSGHNFIGTSTWYWKYSYIDEIYARNLTLSGANDGIYYTGSKATYQMIQFIDNTSDTYGNGIAIGGGGQTIIGGGESTSTLIGRAGTGGAEIMWIGNDGDIELFPGQQNGFNEAYKTIINPYGINIGIEGNTTKESGFKVSSGAGSIGLYSSSSTTGNRGLWAYPHGTATSGKNIISLDTNNNINYASGTAGYLYMTSGSGVVHSSGAPSFYFLRGDDSAVSNRMGLIFCNYGTTNNITRCDKIYLRHYSYNSSTGAAIDDWDQYCLPAVTPDLTTSHTYNILTTKDMSFSITGNAATATRINGNLAEISSATYCNIWVSSNARASGIPNYVSGVYVAANTGIITAKGFSGPLTGNVTGNCSGSSGSCTGNATTCTYPLGFSARVSNATWGHQTGSTVTQWSIGSCAVDFRKDNPSSGKLSIKVNGRFYGNEGTYPAMLMNYADGCWGMGDPDAVSSGWLRVPASGLLTNTKTGSTVGSGSGYIGAIEWRFKAAYIDTLNGNCSGNAATATKATGDSDGNTINTTYAKLSGAAFTGNIAITKAGDAYVYSKNSSTGNTVYLDSGSGANHGIYSGGYYNGSSHVASGKWLIYRNDAGNVIVNGDCTGNAATATKDSAGNVISSTYLKLSGGTMSGHIYLGGSSSSSTANTTQIVFGTSSSQHIAVSSISKALVLNPTTSSTTSQIVLALEQASTIPYGINTSQQSTMNRTNIGKFIDFCQNGSTCGCLRLQALGTTTAEGYADLLLGNITKSNANKNATGRVYLANSNGGWLEIKAMYGSLAGATRNYININNWLNASGVTGAVWNDYAEFRKTNKEAKAGQVVIDNDDGSLSITNKRLMPGAQIVSDTFGFSIGETEEAKTPLAVSGRVLVYTYRPREEYHAGMAVCSAPNGTIDIMTREEIQQYPDAIIGIVSEIPEYEEWGTGKVKVNGRIWIKIK